MSQTTTPPQTVEPPEEAFWTRYSPHHEFSLSNVSSVATHILLFGLIALVIWARSRFGLKDERPPVPVDAVAMAPSGGGGGNPLGKGTGAGVGDPAHSGDDPTAVEPTPGTTESGGSTEPPEPARERLQEARKEALTFPEFKDPTAQRLIQEGGPAVDSIMKLTKDTREKLSRGLSQGQPIGPGQGQGGTGSGGGKGEGVGTGTGDDYGPGTGTIKRQERVLRWTLIFNTLDGGDYASQLRGLGAILAIPDPTAPGQYLAIEDLGQRPVRPARKDLADIKRIYWIDDKPDSVSSLSRALGLPGVPPHIVAFFPGDLERKLLDLELKYRGLREDQIRETRFEVRRTANGYTPRVISQR